MGKRNKKKQAELTSEVSSEDYIPLKIKKSHEKHAQIDNDNNPQEVLLTSTKSEQNAKVSREKRKFANNKNDIMKNLPRKTIFVDDKPQEMPSNSGATLTKKKIITGNSEDDAVNDEDIDRFCEELDEEDNAQYENWVTLIEEKLKG